MRKIFISLVSMFMFLSMSVPNVRANGATYESSGHEADSLTADKAFDNDLTTRWASTEGVNEKFLSVRYSEAKTIAGFQIYWERKNVVSYEVLAQVGSEWQKVYTGGQVTSFVETVAFETPVNAQAFKLVIKDFSPQGVAQKKDYGTKNPFESITWSTVSIYEFKLLETVPTVVDGNKNANIFRGATPTLHGELDTETASTISLTNLTDGDPSTRWATNRNKNRGQIHFDMQALKKIHSLRFNFDPRANVGGPNITEMDIYSSVDGTLWAPEYRHTGTPTAEFDVNFDAPFTARYLKLDIKNTKTSTWDNVSIGEVQAFSKSLSTNVTLNQITQLSLNADRTRLEIPQIEGGVVTLVGSTADQVIDLTGKVYEPLTAVTVKVMLQLEVEGVKTMKQFSVNVPGKYNDHGVGSTPSVIPAVQQYHNVDGTTNITNATSLIVPEEFKQAALQYQGDLRARGVEVSINDQNATHKITFEKDTTQGLGKEGYYINIEDNIKIVSETSTGAYYGAVTLLHIGQTNIQKGEIKDYPMYKERKFSLDTGRKFFPVPVVKEIIKNMAYYKMNMLQMHLNDNYIWLERLTTLDNPDMEEVLRKMDPGFRIETSFENNGVKLTSKDHYTKEEFRKFVLDGKQMGVEIVPEIDSPGHAGSFVKMRPDLMYPDDNPNNPRHLQWRNKPKAERAAMLDLSKEASFTLVSSVLRELVGTSENPGAFYDVEKIHIGTDEYYGNKEDYRRYVDRLLKFVKNDLNKIPKFWGSLKGGSYSLNGVTEVTNEAEMDVWSLGWNSLEAAINDGYTITNILDVPTYSVPGMNGLNNRNGGYTDFINNRRLFSWDPTDFTGNRANLRLDHAHPQINGGGYALWNDMNTDYGDLGLTSYDLFDRFFEPLAVAAQKTWNSPTVEYDAFAVLAQAKGYAPQTDPKFTRNIDTTQPIFQLSESTIAGATNVTAKPERFEFNEGVVETTRDYVGLDSILTTTVRLLDHSKPQKLLSTNKDHFYLVDEEGYVAYQYDGRHIQFDYRLPLNEKVHLKLSSKQYNVQLFVNGIEVSRRINPMKPNIAYTTFLLPIHKIGDGLKAYVYDLKIVNETYVDPTILPHTLFTNPRANSAHPNHSFEGEARYAFDNNPNTWWHTKYGSGRFTVSESNPATIEVDLTSPQTVASLVYKPRPGGGNGTIKKYEVYLKVNDAYTTVPVARGQLENNGADKYITFNQVYENVTGLKINVLAGHENFASASEFVLRKPAERVSLEDVDTTAFINKINEYKALLASKDFGEVIEAKLIETLDIYLERVKDPDVTQEQLETMLHEIAEMFSNLQEITPKDSTVVLAENIATDIAQLKAILNQNEVADTIGIEVNKNTTAQLNEENEKRFDTLESYNIEVKKDGVNVTHLDSPVRLTLTLTKAYDAQLYVVREHEGVFTVLKDLDTTKNTVTFETDRFSNYTVVSEKVEEQPKPPVVTPEKPPVVTPQQPKPVPPVVTPQQPKPVPPVVKPQQPKENSKKDVNTSDQTNHLLWMFVFVMAGSCLLLLNRRKDK